jgi:hypothetical protein
VELPALPYPTASAETPANKPLTSLALTDNANPSSSLESENQIFPHLLHVRLISGKTTSADGPDESRVESLVGGSDVSTGSSISPQCLHLTAAAKIVSPQ